MTLTSLRGRGTPGAAKTAPDGDRLLIRFTFPNDIRGTGFLVWERPAQRRRALSLPAGARPRAPYRRRRGAGELRRQRLHLRRHRRTRVRRVHLRTVDENASWTPPSGGPARPAWRLESRRKDTSARFPRVVSLILKDSVRRRAGRPSTTGATRSRRCTPCAVSSRFRASGRRWSPRCVTRSTARGPNCRREGGVQRRADRDGLQPARAGARRQVSRAFAEVIYRFRFILSIVLVAGAVGFAPRRTSRPSTTTSPRGSREATRLPGLRALPRRVRRHPHAHRRAPRRQRRTACSRAKPSSIIERISERHRARRDRAARGQPGHRHDRPGASRTTWTDGGLDVRPLLEDLEPYSPDPTSGRRRSATSSSGAISSLMTGP
jgi:hypothetical protein